LPENLRGLGVFVQLKNDWTTVTGYVHAVALRSVGVYHSVVAVIEDPITAAAFDLNGNLIWFSDLQDGAQLDSPFSIKLLPSGDFLMVPTGVFNGIREIDLAGDLVTQLSIDNLKGALTQVGIKVDPLFTPHHDILPLANGHLIVLANAFRTFTARSFTKAPKPKPETVFSDGVAPLAIIVSLTGWQSRRGILDETSPSIGGAR
jgi:Arylsulfotransferase (ASST)